MINETNFRTRVNYVLNVRNLNPRSLSGGDDNLWKKLYNQITKEKTITFSLIEALANKVPDLSLEWLFRGTGKPFLDGTSVEEQLAALEERLSRIEGERETDNQEAMAASI